MKEINRLYKTPPFLIKNEKQNGAILKSHAEIKKMFVSLSGSLLIELSDITMRAPVC